MQSLAERFRPKCWDEVVGQDEVTARLKRLAAMGWLTRRAFWLSGPSGTGKTTIARLIAAEVADEFCTLEMDAGSLTLSRLQEFQESMHLRGFGEKGGRAFILNESHGLRRDTLRALLVLLENLPEHVTFVFTSTADNMESFEAGSADALPLLSRCLKLELRDKDLSKPFAERARTIARAEGLDGKPLEAYLHLARRTRCNLREMLNRIECGELEAGDPATVESEPEAAPVRASSRTSRGRS